MNAHARVLRNILHLKRTKKKVVRKPEQRPGQQNNNCVFTELKRTDFRNPKMTAVVTVKDKHKRHCGVKLSSYLDPSLVISGS